MLTVFIWRGHKCCPPSLAANEDFRGSYACHIVLHHALEIVLTLLDEIRKAQISHGVKVLVNLQWKAILKVPH